MRLDMSLLWKSACRQARIIICCAVLLQSGATARAHHSESLSESDSKHPVTLVGTVVELRLVNPHSSIVFDAKDEQGNLRRWHIELASATSLRRAGWDDEKLKSGQSVTVVGAPAKDGSPAVSAQHEARITLTDSNTVIYDKGRPVWLSIFRFFQR
jgi:hypothetical protein